MGCRTPWPAGSRPPCHPPAAPPNSRPAAQPHPVAAAGVLQPLRAPRQWIAQHRRLEGRESGPIALAGDFQDHGGKLVATRQPQAQVRGPFVSAVLLGRVRLPGRRPFDNPHRRIGPRRSANTQPPRSLRPSEPSNQIRWPWALLVLSRWTTSTPFFSTDHSALYTLPGAAEAAARRSAARMAPEDHPFPTVLAADGRPVGLRPRLDHARAHHEVGRAPGVAQQAAPLGVQGINALLHVEQMPGIGHKVHRRVSGGARLRKPWAAQTYSYTPRAAGSSADSATQAKGR